MRKIFFILILLFLTGCATVEIPQYVQDQHPYKETFYSSFEDAVEGTSQALEQFGWKIANHYDPGVFEQNKENIGPEAKQIVLSTEVRQMPFFLGTRYARVNAHIYSLEHSSTAVEIRYLTVTSVPFKSFNSYRNDRAAERILKTIKEKLN